MSVSDPLRMIKDTPNWVVWFAIVGFSAIVLGGVSLMVAVIWRFG